MRRIRSTVLAVALVSVSGPVAAQGLTAMSDAEREAFRAEVRAYLMENPEVLMEAIGVLEARDQQAQAEADVALVASHAERIRDDGHSWVGGNPDGDITVVEFMDYRCGYCRRAFQEVEDLVAGDGNIRFVLKELPILGEQSDLASRFAVAVQQLHGPDAYKDAHDALMLLESDVSSEALARLAEGLGLDPAAVLERMGAPEVTAVIEANHDLARDLGISGTPTFVMGDQLVRGYVPLDSMQAIVAEERAG